MKLGIIITCKNLWETTKAAYESIHSEFPYHVCFVSDFSTDLTNARLTALAQTQENVSVELTPLTKSLAGKWNLGVKMAQAAGCDTFLICNNDILFHRGTIDALRARFAEGDAVLVSAHNLRGQIEPDKLPLVALPPRPTESEHPDFSCFMIDEETLELIGWFDTKFEPCYFEDNDYHYRIMKAGQKAVATTAAPYYHFGSMTQNSIPGGVCPAPKFMENRAYFITKHGVDPATYQEV